MASEDILLKSHEPSRKQEQQYLKEDNNAQPVLKTPSSGNIFHPFHESYIAQLEHVAVTPGMFSVSTTHQNNGAAFIPSDRITPSRGEINSGEAASVPFIWSPEVQGDHFPTEIDENPTLQLKLQNLLDADNDDVAQRRINSFFKNHVIAPSPDAHYSQLTQQSPTRYNLPRTSSIIPSITPKGKVVNKQERSSIMMSDVEVQTSISISSDTNLSALLQRTMDLGDKEASGIHIHEASATRLMKPYPHSSLFLCLACQQAHSINRYCRRSLFVEALDTISDVPSISSEEVSSLHCGIHGTTNTHHKKQNDDVDEESAAFMLSLPCNWATESVSQHADAAFMDSSLLLSPTPTTKSTTPPNRPGKAELSILFDQFDLTPIKDVSMRLEQTSPPKCRLSFVDLTPISPIAAGRTEGEARAYRQRHCGPSFTTAAAMDESDDEGEFRSALEDMEGDMPISRFVMTSPQLSPILPSSPLHCPSLPQLFPVSPIFCHRKEVSQ